MIICFETIAIHIPKAYHDIWTINYFRRSIMQTLIDDEKIKDIFKKAEK
jgi:hypothetical protein